MTIARFIASGFGSGYCPVAPGTAGSLVALVLGSVLFAQSPWLLAGAALAIGIGGVWAVHASEAKGDPGWIVIDEFAGQWIALLGLGTLSWLGLLAAFALFRLFDIWKPGPVGWADRWHTPAGVMADDVIAGAMAAGVLLAIRGLGALGGDAIASRIGLAVISGFQALFLIAGAHAASPPATEAQHGMVVSAQRLAAEAGVAILKQGGNAVDAAVAVGYAEAVTNPCCGNIGGGGFLVARLSDGRSVFIDFRESAPAAATATMFLDAQGKPIPDASLHGWKAVAVPGTVAGLDAVLLQYGTLPRATVMAPAIALAKRGYILTGADADIFARGAAKLRHDPGVARIFLHPDGAPYRAGERLIQPELAATLAAIAAHGPDAFYHGAIPARIEAASHGALTAADFAAYKITQSEPLSCAYRGYVFLSAPPPSSGGVALCEILGVLQGYDLRAAGFNAAATIHPMTEAMRHAFFDRNTYLGDPAFVANPMAWLLSPEHAAGIRGAITDKATPSETLGAGVAPHEHPETTHYSVADDRGNAVAVTFTLNGAFGATVIAPGAGFLLNDEMDDFTVKPGSANLFGLVQGTNNAIAPGKRPLSSMTPTIVLHDGHIAMVLGSPGGPRIITIVLQVALNAIDHGMAPQAAVDAPRIHHQWLPDRIVAEPFALSADTKAALTAMGYKIVEQRPWGASALIVVGGSIAEQQAGSAGNDESATGGMRPGWFYGASDPRRPAGAAIGY
jgi:gamma-glutamyltranspeptidase/glutathione hydrolase